MDATKERSAKRVKITKEEKEELMQIEKELDSESTEDDNINFENYQYVKLVANHPHTTKTDIYVSRASSFIAQYKRACDLLNEESVSSIDIHGLGASMLRAIRLAQIIVEKRKIRVGNQILPLIMSPTTSTVALTDEYHPLKSNIKPITKTRYNSAIHIKLTKPKS